MGEVTREQREAWRREALPFAESREYGPRKTIAIQADRILALLDALEEGEGTYLPDPDGSFAMYLIRKERAERAEAALAQVNSLLAEWECDHAEGGRAYCPDCYRYDRLKKALTTEEDER